MSDLTTAVQTILDKQDGYLLAEAYYDGTVEEIFASPAVKRELAKSGDQFRVNYAATPVDAVANRLEVTGVTGTEASAQTLIGSVFQENNLELELTQLITKTLIYGSAYLIAWPDETGQTQIYYNSPLSTVVIYDPENPRKPHVAAKLWPVEIDGKTRHRLNLFYADRIEKYLSASERLPFTVKDSDFEPYIDDETDEQGTVPNEFGQIPVFHFTTGIDQYGRPEHLAAYGAQDMINKLLISQMASVDHYGFPTRYALAASHEGTPVSLTDETDDDDVLDSSPGSVWWLQNVEKVGQFTAADPKSFIDPYREYVRAMASVTSTPFHVFEAVATNVSGQAVRAAEAPLVKKTRTRQLSIGNTLRRLFLFVLAINKIPGDVQVHWRQIESIDTAERWEIANRKVQAGLPVEQVLAEEGYDTEQIETWKTAGLLNKQENINNIEGETAA
ncbi:Phage portal protein, SPP1 Gp6-like [Rhodococcoides kroppenstedtii]|uniref:Phage portal protein, SPP1 Gp6-like n=1 Tax=Rhodococcoides kroppenstedtii TaxID=293050 RepID=A0A1I0SRC8_9NOCA|nr:phage portal protein [Rhodococcus kroppenstedtii]MBT1192895.1 phage portal protein [Rhodococcus kroppenstedtii]SFA41316.1 Phage portal protein, SPP1 Gp6-like [Rhodococcus kroppenstedtii]